MRFLDFPSVHVTLGTRPRYRYARYLVSLVMCAASASAQVTSSRAVVSSPPAAIENLRTATSTASAPEFAQRLEDGEGYSAALVSYRLAGRRLHALVATPKGQKPREGFPVLMALHGFHPNPPRYGYGKDGLDQRPGDYYRSVPSLYTKAGYLVVMPDYRGHSSSEGLEFTNHPMAAAYYAEDVVGLMHGLSALPHADHSQIFVWGHSMGGEIALRVLLAWPEVRAASLWSTTGGDAWEQAHHYDRLGAPLAPDSDLRPKAGLNKLRQALAEFGLADRNESREPLLHLGKLRTPIVMHHALDDSSTDYGWSARLARELYLRSLRYEFYSYSGSDHFFNDPQRAQAVERDLAFFRAHRGSKD